MLTNENSTRIKTGLVLFLAIFIIGYIDSYFLFWLFFGTALMFSIKEAKTLYGLKGDSIYIYSAILWLAAYFYPIPEDLLFIVAISYASQLAYSKKIDKKVFLPLFYPTASFLFLLSLYSEYGVFTLLWLLVIVSGADIGAYYVGKNFGQRFIKRKFSETSPNKSLEGVIGGVAIAAILGVFFANENLSVFSAFIISIIVALASVFGDLFESYLKREAGVKDSGTILPGHGGILDRTDGYLFGAIVMIVLLRILM